MTPRAIHRKRGVLMRALFAVDYSQPVVHYFLRAGADAALAAITWPDHGVCPHCHTRGIMDGRCLDCGVPLPPAKSYAMEWGPIARNAAEALHPTLRIHP